MNEQNDKITLDKVVADLVFSYSQGNPGAMTVVTLILKAAAKDLAYMQCLDMFDKLKLKGSKLYMLWNDCCNRDIDKILKITFLLKLGELTEQDIHEHINYEGGRGREFDRNLLNKVTL